MRLDPSKYLTSIYDNPHYVTQILEDLYQEMAELQETEDPDVYDARLSFDDTAQLATLQDLPGYLLTQSALDVIERIKVSRNFDLELLKHDDPKPRYYDFYISSVLSLRVKWSQRFVAALVTRRKSPESTMVETRAQLLHLLPMARMTTPSEEEFQLHQWLVRILLFMELTEPQFLVLPPNKKFSRHPVGYVNPTPNKLIIVTSKWNYHVVRAEGFDVSGHYRAQRVGPGRKGVKMTWIQPHRRNGYVRKAHNEK